MFPIDNERVGVFEPRLPFDQIDLRMGCQNIFIFGRSEFIDSSLLLGNQLLAVYHRLLFFNTAKSMIFL